MTPSYLHQSFIQQQAPQPHRHYETNRDQHLITSTEFQEPAAKRQRNSMSMGGGEGHDREARFTPRLQTEIPPYNQYSPGYHVPSGQSFRHPGGPYSTPSTVSDIYQFGNQRTNSSAASSPYVSPQTDYTGNSSMSSSHFQMQHSRDSSFHQPHPIDMYQQKRIPQFEYPTPPKHHDQPPQRQAPVSASRSAAEVLAGMSHSASDRTAARPSNVRDTSEDVVLSPNPAIGRPVLPPLQSMVPAARTGSAPQLRSSNVLPPIGGTLARESDRGPDTQPYQRHQIAPPPISSSSI